MVVRQLVKFVYPLDINGHSSYFHLFYSKKIDGDQGLCEIFCNLATGTKDANEKKSYLIQCISEMAENTLSANVNMIAEMLEACLKVDEEVRLQ